MFADIHRNKPTLLPVVVFLSRWHFSQFMAAHFPGV
jgi:hypothetical protein